MSDKRTQPAMGNEAACTLAREFLSDWEPFASRFDNYVGLSARWVGPHWLVDLTPAMDVKCEVVVSDESAQAREARIIAMRTGRVQSEWRAD